MDTIRLVTGKIFFEEFEGTDLDPRWEVTPNDTLRYTLADSFINIYHGVPKFMLLTNEPDNYVLDLKNDYIPVSTNNDAGIIVFKSIDGSLEILEYFDVLKSAVSVYEYIRLVKSGDIYTVYGKNNDFSDWSLIGSVEFKSAGKVGLCANGPSLQNSPVFKVDYIRVYKSQRVKYLNIPPNYRVEFLREDNTLIDTKIVGSLKNGVEFLLEDVPPINAYFKLYDETNNLIHTSRVYDVCGGDMFFYGAGLTVTVNGYDLRQDTDYFLGYYKNSEIDLDIRLTNEYQMDFHNVVITTAPYENDESYSFVRLSVDNINFFPSLNLGTVAAGQTIQLYGKILRDNDYLPFDATPNKFYIKIESR